MTEKLSRQQYQQVLLSCLITAVLFVVSVGGAVATFSFFSSRMLPGTTINSIPVGGLSIEEATSQLEASLVAPADNMVTIAVDDISVSTSAAALNLHYNIDETATQAFLIGKQGHVVERFFEIISSFISPPTLTASLAYDQEKLTNLLTDLKLAVDVIGEQPAATLVVTSNPETIAINPGKPGRVVDLEQTIAAAQAGLENETFSVAAVVASTSAELSEPQQVAAKERAEKLVGKEVLLKLDLDHHIQQTLTDKALIQLLAFADDSAYRTDLLKETLADWAETINRPPQDAKFEYDSETLVVTTFQPHKLGLELNVDDTAALILQELENLETSEAESAEIITITTSTQPDITLADTNDLGITERIGYGDSEYDHSIPNRIHNGAITTQRVSNTIVPPKAEFSFNKTLGEVSARTGYRTAYVIKNGRTELGDGGGVCQVSTTLFRAILNAGLKVTKRLPHSYRVSYYELDSKPGVDATVYSGNVDLRFVNDTDHHILIHGAADSKNLTMFYEIYGTSDGRTAEIVDHKTWDARPAPAPEYYDDPTLPAGTVKQVDWSAPGIKASFKNVVKDTDGNVMSEEEYYSNYRPWSAKYLRGVGG